MSRLVAIGPGLTAYVTRYNVTLEGFDNAKTGILLTLVKTTLQELLEAIKEEERDDA